MPERADFEHRLAFIDMATTVVKFHGWIHDIMDTKTYQNSSLRERNLVLGEKQKEQLYVILCKTKEELETFIEDTNISTKPVDLDEPIGRVSRGDAMQQQQMALANSRKAKQRLENIKRAITRYQNGESGVCFECGEDISFGRLKALPESTICIECAN